MTRRTFAALPLAALPARPAESSAERGKRAIAETVAALGGDNFLRMRNRAETGRAYSFYREDLTGLSRVRIYTRYSDLHEPGKLGLEERQSFFSKKREESAVLFLDGQGFNVTFRGARPLPDAQIERYFQTTWHNVFYILRMRYREPGLIFEHSGSDVIENQSVEIVDIYDRENEKVSVYLASATRLPVRQRYFRRDPVSKERFEEVTRFSKYRAAGKGVQWPLDLQRERDTEKLAEIYDETVRIDDNLESGLFRLPADIKILNKEK